jgi:hypothetical protein
MTAFILEQKGNRTPHPGVSDAEFFRRYELELIGLSLFWKS